MNKPDVYDQYEQLPDEYHNDPRCKLVEELRKQDKIAESNGIVFQIRENYGFEE